MTRRIALAVMVVLLAAGCTQDEFAPPQNNAACYDLAADTGSGDADSFYRLAVDDTSHRLDEPIAVYVCVGPDKPADVTVSEAEGVRVSPEEQRIGAGDPPPVSFEVSLVDDKGGRLQLALDFGGGSSGTTSVFADVDGDEWSLELPY